MIHNKRKESTLVIVFGNVRGGEKTWETLYRNLIDVYDADLALAVGESEDNSSSLYTKAKYLWELKEYGEDWSGYYIENGLSSSLNSIMKSAPHIGLSGPAPGRMGSGLLVQAFKHFVLNNYLSILEEYDRIIWTRTDQYYFKEHPILPLTDVWIPEGQDWGGVCDRFAMFPSKESKRFLSVVETIENNQSLVWPDCNCEKLFLSHLEHNGLSKSIKRYDRVQATVCVDSDNSRWRSPSEWSPHPEHNDIKLKYPEEYFNNMNGQEEVIVNKTPKTEIEKISTELANDLLLKLTSFESELKKEEPKEKTRVDKFPKMVISFCLWGDNKMYTVGAIKNAELAQQIYPGWECWFYVSESVPSECISKLEQFPNVKVIAKKIDDGWENMFWRFEPIWDKSVDVVISRDCDSRLNYRERSAVDDWLLSDKGFHIMRDHPLHGWTILGGMWGLQNKKYFLGF